MTEPRYQRRKESRPAEITEAAMEVFAENGYAAARLDDVARRAGVSKGLLYLYFRTKEELFKAVIRSFIAPKVEALIGEFENSNMSSEAFLRGPFLDLARYLPTSRARILIRLLITEGPRYPDLVAYYWENVVSRGLGVLQHVLERGVQNGEFRKSALLQYPQILLSPVLVSIIWNSIFAAHREIDTDALIEGQIELLLRAIVLEEDQS